MAKISPLMILPPVVFAAFAVAAYVGMFSGSGNDLPSTRIGKPAPAITEDTLGDYPGVTAEMLRSGEATVVNFWASWCPPCRAEHPVLLEMAAEGVPIIGVNFKDQEDAAMTYLANEENPFVGVAFDPQGRTAIEWGVTAPPESFIVGGDGTVLFRLQGPLVGAALDKMFRPELQKAQR